MKLTSVITAAILSTIYQINKRNLYLEIGASNWAGGMPYVFLFVVSLFLATCISFLSLTVRKL